MLRSFPQFYRVANVLALILLALLAVPGKSAEPHAIDVELELAKLAQYERRIVRLERTIHRLNADHDVLGRALEEQRGKVQRAQERYRLAQRDHKQALESLSGFPADQRTARRHHAEFAFYLVERDLQEARQRLEELNHKFQTSRNYLQNRQDLLRRNLQGVKWQHAVLRKAKLEPDERLAQLQ